MEVPCRFSFIAKPADRAMLMAVVSHTTFWLTTTGRGIIIALARLALMKEPTLTRALPRQKLF